MKFTEKIKAFASIKTKKEAIIFCILAIVIMTVCVFSVVACSSEATPNEVPNTSENVKTSTSEDPETSEKVDNTESTEVPESSSNSEVPGSTTAPEMTKNPLNTKAPTTTSKVPATTTHTHSYTKTNSVAATCTTSGSETFTCACGNSYTNKTNALGHSYGGWVVIQEASTTSTGKKECKCDRCGGAPIYETIPVKTTTTTTTTTTASMSTSIDSRVRTVSSKAGNKLYAYGLCYVADKRSGNNAIQIRVNSETSLYVSYCKPNGTKVSTTVSTPSSEYKAMFTIKSDGSYTINLISAIS